MILYADNGASIFGSTTGNPCWRLDNGVLVIEQASGTCTRERRWTMLRQVGEQILFFETNDTVAANGTRTQFIAPRLNHYRDMGAAVR